MRKGLLFWNGTAWNSALASWPTGDPPPPGTFGQRWRQLYRPDINYLSADGNTGPGTTDESGSTYPTRVDGNSFAALGTIGSPASITYDRVNGWTSTTGTLSGIGATHFLTESGLPTLKSTTVVGTVLVDGAVNLVASDVTVSGTAANLALSGNPTKSNVNSIVAGGFPTGAGTYYAMVGRTLCLFDNATSTVLNNVRTVDGQTHQIFAGEQATWVDQNGLSMVAARLRDVRIIAPVAVSLTKARTTLASAFTITTIPKNATIAITGITSGASPGTITVNSTTGFASSGTILVGNDFVAYTGTTSTTFTGCTWPGGGATASWAIGYFVFANDNYTISLSSASSFPAGPGVIELDASVEIHYSAKSGNNLTGCAVATRWSSAQRTYPQGLEVRTCISDAMAEVSDPSLLYGQMACHGARLDARDCVTAYSSKGPGSIRFFGNFGTKVDRHYTDLNWYDVGRVYGSNGLLNITRSIFVTHPGTGNTGSPHVDGIQGWHATQIDGSPLVADSAFLGSLTNSHEFWNAAGAGNAASNESLLPVPDGLYYDNCLIASSQAGSSNGKGGLIDESINCGAQRCWYDNNLSTTLSGPAPSTTASSDVAAAATSIPLTSTTNFTAGAPTTTLISDTTVTKDTTYAVILATLSVTDATSATATKPIYIVLDDGTKTCCLRADFRSASVLQKMRWIQGTAGTYTAAGTTVYISNSSNPAPGFAMLTLDSVSRMGVVVFTGISGGALTGVKANEYAIKKGAVITPFDRDHPPGIRIRNIQNHVWNATTKSWDILVI